MKGLWCYAVQLQLMSVSCTFDPNYDQQAQHDDANGGQSQKHRRFSSILSNIRFTKGLRRSVRGVSAGREVLLPFAATRTLWDGEELAPIHLKLGWDNLFNLVSAVIFWGKP